MLRVVIDTNIFVSALLSKKGIPARILAAWRERKFLVFTNEEAILEVERVLQELVATGKYVILKEDIESILNLLRKDTILVPGQIDTKGSIPQDPSDEKYLSIALEGEANIIISGDKHLLDLSFYQNVSIQNARQFLDTLNAALSE
jgi:putative PIN family toxin of toxin-antitoxin system